MPLNVTGTAWLVATPTFALGTVSYTHLDVYKRQSLTDGLAKVQVTPAGRAAQPRATVSVNPPTEVTFTVIVEFSATVMLSVAGVRVRLNWAGDPVTLTGADCEGAWVASPP